jgi:hypothetical protein
MNPADLSFEVSRIYQRGSETFLSNSTTPTLLESNVPGDSDFLSPTKKVYRTQKFSQFAKAPVTYIPDE